MYAALGTREMWTGYFRYRMIYFSERCSKPLSPLVLAGDLGGFCDRDRGCRAQFPAKRLTGKLAGLAATGAVRSLEVAVLDKITGEALPELPGGRSCGHLPTSREPLSHSKRRGKRKSSWRGGKPRCRPAGCRTF